MTTTGKSRPLIRLFNLKHHGGNEEIIEDLNGAEEN